MAYEESDEKIFCSGYQSKHQVTLFTNLDFTDHQFDFEKKRKSMV